MKHLSGIGRTTNDLMLAFDRFRDDDVEIAMFTRTVNGKIHGDFSFRLLNIPLPYGDRVNFLFKNFPLLDLLVKHDLLHIPHNYSVVNKPSKTVITIHDAMFFSYPENFLSHEHARQNYPRLARECRAIITCSNNSKSDIVKYMDIHPDKVTVVPWGVNDQTFYYEDKGEAFKKVRSALKIDRPFFMSVSCDVGRKNTVSIMRAYRQALKKKIGHDLVLVWGNCPDEYRNEFAAEIQAGNIKIIGNVDDDLLRLLYCASTLSWFPSKYEGFGLPILESMACGTPVVTCRNSSLMEVGGSTALYVDPDGLDEMTDVMLAFDKGIAGYDELVSDSIAHSKRYTWENTARMYMEFYKSNM
jgi:glycosyltransferase involved in cell wall biosynthesis